MKQIKILGVLAIALALGLTACGGAKSSKSESKSETPSSVVPSSSSEAPAESSEAPAESSEAPAESSESSESSTRHTHQWGDYVTTKEATCTEDGEQKRVCSICGQEQTKTIKAAHTWGEYVTTKPATCSAVGKEERECAVCHEKQERDIAKIDHTLVEVLPADDNNVPEGGQKATAATCTEAGVKVEVCSVCGERIESPINALGHDWDEWVDINPADCTHDGLHKHTCKRCNIEEQEEVPALGHDIQLIGDDTEPEAGKAKVRVYQCANGCGITYLGFKANEVSEESQGHLSFTEVTNNGKTEIGASFWGRPIGNALSLEADGSSTNSQPDECVYCSTETGDFFEYVFDLTQEQINQAGLDDCLLYLDAKPANYMNGGDFFAYREGNSEDWTPGFYIDGADDHIEKDAETGEPVMVKDHAKLTSKVDVGVAGAELETEVPMGKRITDYRYTLYVDDAIKAFDDSIKNPTHGSNTNMTREEFILPYHFSLHEGTNKIRLCMAGGYRSTFFNFTFRPTPTPLNVTTTSIEIRPGKTAQIESTEVNLTYKSANKNIATVSETGLVTGVATGNTTITVSKDGNYQPVEIPVTILQPEGVVQISAQEGAILPEAGEGVTAGAEWYVSGYQPSASRLRNFQKDSTVTFTFNSELAGKFDITFNARGTYNFADCIAVKVNNADVAVSGSVASNNSGVDVVIGQADLVKGENTLVISTPIEGSSFQLHYVKVAPHQYETVKAWSSADIKAGITEGQTLTEKDFGNSLPDVKGYKFNNANATVTLTVNLEAAAEVELQLLMGVKSGNQAKTGFWTQVDSTSDPKPEKDSITVNGAKVTPPAQDVDFSDCTTASDQSDNGTLMVPAWKTVCSVSLNAGDNTIVIAYVAGGYSIYLCGAQLIK